MDEILKWSAVDVVHRLRMGQVTPLDCLDALQRRIAAVNAPVNALVTLCFERARKHAHELMARSANERGLLAGLPR